SPNFIALHEMFDKFNEQAEEHVDDLAERIVQLGGHAHGTLASVAKTSPLPAYPAGFNKAADHLDALAEHTAFLGSLVRKGIAVSADAGDANTADLLTAVSRDLDKRLWFIEAHLQDKG
ncbi:MAG: DNA starvation/stationary phase protection protein Dps, partial [bacterium]